VCQRKHHFKKPTTQPPKQQPNGTANPKASTQHAQPVLCSAWSADGTRVFAGGCDKLVKMWDLQTGQSQQVHARVCGGGGGAAAAGVCEHVEQERPECARAAST